MKRKKIFTYRLKSKFPKALLCFRLVLLSCSSQKLPYFSFFLSCICIFCYFTCNFDVQIVCEWDYLLLCVTRKNQPLHTLQFPFLFDYIVDYFLNAQMNLFFKFNVPVPKFYFLSTEQC